jgi:hypothetical protein
MHSLAFAMGTHSQLGSCAAPTGRCLYVAAAAVAVFAAKFAAATTSLYIVWGLFIVIYYTACYIVDLILSPFVHMS